MLQRYRAEMRQILAIGWPLALAQLLQMSMVFVDTIVVGSLGVESLGAMSVASILYNQVWLFSYGTISALSPFIAQSVGAQQPYEIRKWFRHGILIAVTMGLLSIPILQLSGPLLRMFHQPEDIIPLAVSFIAWISLGLPAFLCYFCFRHLVEATSNSRITLRFAALGALLNIPLDLIFVFGWGPIPAMGVKGAGIATATVQCCMLAGMILTVQFHPTYRALHLWQDFFKFNGKTLLQMIKVGLPVGVSIMAELLFFGSCTILMGTMGKLELAAHHIAFNAVAFAFMIPLGLSFATTVRVGQAYGRQDLEGVKLAAKAANLLISGIMTVVMIVFMVSPGLILNLYTSDVALIALASTLLRVGGIFQIFDGAQLALMACLRGLKDTRFPMLNALLGFWLVGIPVGYLLAFRAGLGPVGLWYGMVLALAAAALFHLLRWRTIVARTVFRTFESFENTGERSRSVGV